MLPNIFSIVLTHFLVTASVGVPLEPVPARNTAPSSKDAPMAWKEMLEKKTFEKDGGALPYRLMRPETMEPGKKYPLVIFLHGAGERGTDNEVQLVHGVKEFAKPEARKKYPCFLVAPQCPTGHQWVQVPWGADKHDMPPVPSAPASLLVGLMDELQKSLPVDPDRVYITGLSMGGYGTWDLLSRQPERFAAAVPVCGGGDEKKAGVMKKVPIWAFHGGLDVAVPVARSRNMVDAVNQAGGNARYTEYPQVGHDSWNPCYADPEMMEWLFGQKRGK
jgi:predicted peptidase